MEMVLNILGFVQVLKLGAKLSLSLEKTVFWHFQVFREFAQTQTTHRGYGQNGRNIIDY